mmetsp:Transcript_2785/g.3670  ORF Transcript_2785/g.3670 Transcript_2785/m.3670 type:complete len:81 (+) Transcript_2785:543-785(+)
MLEVERSSQLYAVADSFLYPSDNYYSPPLLGGGSQKASMVKEVLQVLLRECAVLANIEGIQPHHELVVRVQTTRNCGGMN